MDYIEFTKDIVLKLEDNLFTEMKDVLVGEYISFSIINKKDISRSILSEKLCDYFEKNELKTGKTFEKMLDKYMSDFDSVIGSRIEKEPKTKKNEPTLSVPRARRYYDKACVIRKSEEISLIDFSRIMLCLYSEIINRNFEIIDDFEYCIRCLNLAKIIEALRNETIFKGKKLKFDIREPYGSDRCTFVILIIIYYYIKSNEIIGEY